MSNKNDENKKRGWQIFLEIFGAAAGVFLTYMFLTPDASLEGVTTTTHNKTTLGLDEEVLNKVAFHFLLFIILINLTIICKQRVFLLFKIKRGTTHGGTK